MYIPYSVHVTIHVILILSQLTPTECTMHFGVPVVPDEYIMNMGWLKGTCSNFSPDPLNS